jgi:hypothetical protein
MHMVQLQEVVMQYGVIKMSYNEQAKNINEKLKQCFNEQNVLKKELIDAILYFGQVAKYRCRSNAAYDNFARECFDGIATLEREKLNEQLEFEVLKVKEVV